MGGAVSIADPPWRSHGKRFSRLAWLSGYAERIDQGCSVVLLAVAAYVMNKLEEPQHQAIGLAITIIQGFRFTHFLFKRSITVKDKRLNMIHEFAHYVNGGSIMAMTYGLLIHSFPLLGQYEIFVITGLLGVFSIINFPELLLLMKRYGVFRSTAFLLTLCMVIEIWFALSKFPVQTVIPLLLMVVGGCFLALILCYEEVTKRMNFFFHIGLCLLCVIWNMYSLSPLIGYGVILLVGTFFTGNTQIPAVIGLTLLSYISLFKRDKKYSIEAYICYMSTMTEGLSYLVVCWLEQLAYTWVKFTLARELNICHKNGLEALESYYDNIYRACGKDKVSFDSLRIEYYAMECLDSKEICVRLNGLILLESIVEKDDQLVSQISSSKALTTIFSFLGSISQEKEHIMMRMLAAKIILAIDGRALQVVGARQGIAMISSLLGVTSVPQRKNRRTQRSPLLLVDFFRYIRNPDKDLGEYRNDEDSLALMGLRILQNMLDHSEYISETRNSRDLLNKVVAFMDTSIMMEGKTIYSMRSEEERIDRMNKLHDRHMTSLPRLTDLQRIKAHRMIEAFKDTSKGTEIRMMRMIDEEKKYISSSLNLILKLASFKSLMGNELRDRFFEIPSFLTNLYNILDNDYTNDWKRIGIHIV